MMQTRRREMFAHGAAAVGFATLGFAALNATPRRSVLTPARRAELLAALRGNADDPLARDAAVRQEDFEVPVTRAPCEPLTWAELIALMEQDGRV